MRAPSKKTDQTKANGVHYTPPELAAFLADVTASEVQKGSAGHFRVLDPACGDGSLLVAISNSLPQALRSRMILEGYETDANELAKAGAALEQYDVANIVLNNRDFLSEKGIGNLVHQRGLFDEELTHHYDLVIANPPYVRTQVMGAMRAQALSRQFGISGRVDLYHAFAIAMASVIKPGGVIGLLTSNRFLSIKSGASIRELFSTHFDIEAIYDLGDTKLFTAAVLPVIVVARRGKANSPSRCEFHRIYKHRNGSAIALASRESILSALRDHALTGVVDTPAGTFDIQRGMLAAQTDTWSLTNSDTHGWLETVAARQAISFGDIAKVRVGIKSTADEVFVRDEWESLPSDIQPEADLLRPLLTHREAARWLPKAYAKRVVYPHATTGGKRSVTDLAEYPKAAAYFERHRARLTSRKYVIDGGRKWYEIWVPHNPNDWRRPKIAYPDISEHPRFYFDASGAIIQGDCYWITLNDGVNTDWLLLMLAVANSTFITKYYDTVFHNKLYAGRRRFMTQYVAKFPLPDLTASHRIIAEVAKLLKAGNATQAAEQKINRLVWEAFGLPEEIPWQRNL